MLLPSADGAAYRKTGAAADANRYRSGLFLGRRVT